MNEQIDPGVFLGLLKIEIPGELAEERRSCPIEYFANQTTVGCMRQ
jgi:hypothetical protein